MSSLGKMDYNSVVERIKSVPGICEVSTEVLQASYVHKDAFSFVQGDM